MSSWMHFSVDVSWHAVYALRSNKWINILIHQMHDTNITRLATQWPMSYVVFEIQQRLAQFVKQNINRTHNETERRTENIASNHFHIVLIRLLCCITIPSNGFIQTFLPFFTSSIRSNAVDNHQPIHLFNMSRFMFRIRRSTVYRFLFFLFGKSCLVSMHSRACETS